MFGFLTNDERQKKLIKFIACQKKYWPDKQILWWGIQIFILLWFCMFKHFNGKNDEFSFFFKTQFLFDTIIFLNVSSSYLFFKINSFSGHFFITKGVSSKHYILWKHCCGTMCNLSYSRYGIKPSQIKFPKSSLGKCPRIQKTETNLTTMWHIVYYIPWRMTPIQVQHIGKSIPSTASNGIIVW